jgi:hypothetical protein
MLPAGSVTAPSLFPTGDTNTGIFFPAADTIAFTEGGVEAMRIDASGNVGIGTTSPGARLEASISAASGERAIQARNTSTAQFSGATTALVGPSTTSTRFTHFNANAGGTQAEFAIQKGDGSGGFSAGLAGYNYTSDFWYFSTAGSERMRITSDGEVYIAGTTDQGAFNLQVNGTGVWGAGAYTNGSDARIKDDISPIASGLDVVAKLRPVQFRYKESWSKDRFLQPGFIAQELQEALADQPYAEGVVHQGPEYMSVSYQTLIPVLTKAVQELTAKLEAAEARIANLENR